MWDIKSLLGREKNKNFLLGQVVENLCGSRVRVEVELIIGSHAMNQGDYL